MTLGQLFKSKRLEIGKSVEQISSATKIHFKILSALEEDHYTDLPARTFTRGFIVSYCKALKLDPEKTLEEYKGFLEEKFAERQDKDKGHQGYVFEGKELEQNKRWLIFGASTAAVFAIAVLLVFKPQNHKRKEKHKEFTEETAEVSEDTTPTLNPPAEASASPAPTLILNATASAPASSSPNASSLAAASPVSTTIASSLAVPAIASAKPTVTPGKPTASKTTPTPSKAATVVATATTTPAIEAPKKEETKTSEATATPSPTPKTLSDKLNKGDDLEAKEATRKITLQAVADVWVRYQIDGKPPMILLLRKGRYLAVKAKEKLVFDTNNIQALHYKTRGAYHDLDQDKFTVEHDGSIKPAEGGVVGAKAFPQSIPLSPNPQATPVAVPTETPSSH